MGASPHERQSPRTAAPRTGNPLNGSPSNDDRIHTPPAVFVGREAELRRIEAGLARLPLVLVCGLPGVGKTATLLRAAERAAVQLGARVLHHRCRAGETAATLVESIVERLGPAPESGALTALGRIAEAASREPLLLCLDDVHRADAEAIREIVPPLLRQDIHLLMASREHLPISPAELDHLVVQIGPLDAGEAAQLWDALVELYGPPSIDRASRAGPVTPFVLKHAFGGVLGPGPDDPLSLGELPPDAGELLSLLCALRNPASAATLAAIAGRDVRAPLGRLVRRLLVERRDRGELAVHDLVRDAVEGGPLAPSPRHHARILAWLRARPEAERGRPIDSEELVHALAADLEEASRMLDLVAETSFGLALVGSVLEQEIVHALARLGAARALSPSQERLALRLRLRRGDDPGEVLGALRALSERGVDVDAERGLAHYYAGAHAEASGLLGRSVRSGSWDRPTRFVLAIIAAECLRTTGRIQDVHALAQDVVGELGLDARQLASLLAGFESVRGVDGQVVDLTQTLHLAVRLARALGIELDRIPVLAAIVFNIRALLEGRAAIAGSFPEELDANVFGRLTARLCEAQGWWVLGDLDRVDRLAGDAGRLSRRHGYWTLATWATALEAEVACARGRPADALRHLDEEPAGSPMPPARGRPVGALRHLAEEPAAGPTPPVTFQPSPRSEVRRLVCRAASRLALGDVDRAAAIAERAVQLSGGFPAFRARAEAIAGRARWLSGLDAGQLDDDAALAGMESAEAELSRGELALIAGRIDEARAAIERSSRRALAQGWALVACRARALSAELLLAQGHLQRAEAQARLALEQADERDLAAEQLHARACLAAVALARGESGPALEHLEAMVELASRHGRPVEGDAARVVRAAVAGEPPASGRGPGHAWAARFHLLGPRPFVRLRSDGEQVRLTASQARHQEVQAPTVVDLVEGSVQIGDRRISVADRPVIRAALGLLARAPGEAVSAEDIGTQVLGLEYHRIEHRSRVSVVIQRLRKLVGEDLVETAGDAYVLKLPSPWVVLASARP